MLDDLHAKHKSKGKSKIEFATRLSADKAKWNADKGREFNNLSKSEIKQLRNILREEISKLTKNF